MEPQLTVVTIMTTNTAHGTYSLSSRVQESASSALNHVRAMGRSTGVEPVHTVGAHGWRWSWEYVTGSGVRCVDTVRVF